MQPYVRYGERNIKSSSQSVVSTLFLQSHRGAGHQAGIDLVCWRPHLMKLTSPIVDVENWHLYRLTKQKTAVGMSESNFSAKVALDRDEG